MSAPLTASAPLPTRRGRGKSLRSLALIDAASAILAEIQPATVRAVCYRLFVARLIPAMTKAETDRVSGQLTWAREHDVIPWPWIVDETREPEHIASWSAPDALIDAAIQQYRKDRWVNQPRRVEVWSEKGTVRGTLRPILDDLGVTFRVMHGYGSATAIHDAAEYSQSLDEPLLVLYVGDYDPSGLHMSAVDLPRRLTEYDANITLRRVALSDDDVTYRHLPSFDADEKSRDPRYRWFTEHYGAHCWEIDALSPNILRAVVREAISDGIDWAQWGRDAKVEALERESLHDVLGAWREAAR